MGKASDKNTATDQPIEVTLVTLATPKMLPRELLKLARKVHPEASKKDIVRAAFRSLIAISDQDGEKSLLLHDFALKGRDSSDT